MGIHMNKLLRATIIFLWLLMPASCGTESKSDVNTSNPQPTQDDGRITYDELVVGYSQIGAESSWRDGETKSIRDTATELGVNLLFSDAQQKQENQIKAIRTFIAQQVDVIGVSPIVETGWESVFQEAKEAGIPIILVDRRADVPEDLYTTFLGSDFVEEGRNAARVLVNQMHGRGNIAELVGTEGSAPAIDRAIGFREVIADYPEMKIIVSESGDFTRAKGEEAMEDMLATYGDQIDALYAHNDDMAIGAIRAIEAFGLKPGEDIKIVSIDAVHDAFQAMIEGKINATIECNPLLGPLFFEVALEVANGENVPKWIPSHEDIFLPENAAEILPTRAY